MKTLCILLCISLINSVKFVIGVIILLNLNKLNQCNETLEFHIHNKQGTDGAAALLMKCKIVVGASDEDVKMIVDKKMPSTHSGLCLLTCLYENAGIVSFSDLQ